MSDPNPQGGSIYDMAKDGTKVPEDAAKPNIIPSKARPDQIGEGRTGGLGASSLHQAADNATATTGFGETLSASGGQLPDDIGHKYSRSGGKERGQESASHGGRNHPTHGSGGSGS